MFPLFAFALSPLLLVVVDIVVIVRAVAVVVKIGGRCGFLRTSGEDHRVVTPCDALSFFDLFLAEEL